MKRIDQIVKIGNNIHRPSGYWTKQVHELLAHLQKEGFARAPKPIGFDDSRREIVSFIPGEVSNYPLSSNAKSLKALISAAKLLRTYHDASENFLSKIISDDEGWQLPCQYPKEVICHGDYAPYNVVLNGEEAIGIIDFDTAHPAPRTWDIAYAIYRWAPLTDPDNKDGFGSIKAQAQRAYLFCESYGLSEKNRKNMSDLIIKRLHALVDYMLVQAAKGDENSQANINSGHHILYLTDIKYINLHKSYIDARLIK